MEIYSPLAFASGTYSAVMISVNGFENFDFLTDTNSDPSRSLLDIDPVNFKSDGSYVWTATWKSAEKNPLNEANLKKSNFF